MKQFSSVVAKIKNGDGVYESIPALRGMSSYEVAKKAGFTGTEEEWLEFMFDDGWVAKFQELEANKANATDVYTKSETLSDDTKTSLGLTSANTPDDAFVTLKGEVDEAKVYQEPWNVDANVGQICDLHKTLSISLPVNDSGEASLDIPMINSGELYVSYYCGIQSSHMSTGSITVLKNGVEVDSVDWVKYKQYFTLISVSKNDIVTIRLSGTHNGDTYSGSATLEYISLFANIETPYKYISLSGGTQVYTQDTESVIDTLLGVTE